MAEIGELHDAAASLAGCGIAIVATQCEKQLASKEIVAQEMEDVLDLEAGADREPVARNRSAIAPQDEAMLEPLIGAAKACKPFPHRRRRFSHLLGRQDEIFLDEGASHRLILESGGADLAQ